MRFILAIILMLSLSSSFGQKILVVDSQSKEVLPFASYSSSDRSCSGYSDLRGIISCCNNVDTLKVHYLGYKTGVIYNFSRKKYDTLYLIKRSYNLEAIIIKSYKTNIYKELNVILKKIRKNNYAEEVNSIFYLESIESDEMMERIQMISNDNLSNKKIRENSRIFGSYLIDKKKPYYSVNIDKFFKNIAFFSKKSSYLEHIFNSKKIKRKRYKVLLLKTNNDNTREVSYISRKSTRIKGIIKYNYKTNEVIEHRFKFKDLDTDFNSLNNSINTSVDSILVLYHFNHNRLAHLTYKIWIYKSSKDYPSRNIISRGYIKILDNVIFNNKIEIPEYNYESLQEEIIFNSKLNNTTLSLDSIFTIDSFFYKKKSPSDFMRSDDTLTFELLNHFNVLSSKRKIWSLSNRLTKKDFISNEAVAHLGGRGKMKFLSDLHNTKIHWIIMPYLNKGRIKYISPNSIWNSEKSTVIYYNDEQSVWVSNAIFDIFELYRRKLIFKLNNSNIKYPQIEIRKFYSDASNSVKRMLKETNYGVRNQKKTNTYLKQQYTQLLTL